MQPWISLAEARSPEGTELVLQQRGSEYVIRANGHVLMSSRTHGSEEAMARAALEGTSAKASRILVGGLGLGYTLRAMLDVADQNASIIVAELLSAVIEWNRGPLGHLSGFPLRDERAEVWEGDVGHLVRRSAPGAFDAIVLDIDNGPRALVQRENQSLYTLAGLAQLKQALRKAGRLVIWSAGPDSAF